MALTEQQKQELAMKKQQIHQNLMLKLILEDLEANELEKSNKNNNVSNSTSIENENTK